MIRLVENVAPFPSCFIPSTVKAIHALADCVESGSIDAQSALLVTIDADGFPDIASVGEPLNNAEVIGYLELVKAQLMKRMTGE